MKLLSIVDLRSRWSYSKAGVHKLVKAKNFPQPFMAVSQGKVKLFREEDIQAYEQDKPWLFDEESKRLRQNLYAIFQKAKADGNPQETLNKLFGQDAKPWQDR
jgi:hypothetical protein